ncbi:T9SS type A sorting domain-containing protein [Bacteroidota bacterium]
MKKLYFLLVSLLLMNFLNAQWTQIGNDIDGEAAGDRSGFSVSLSSDGNTLAIGAPYNCGDSGCAGHVRIYENNAGVWTQIGNDIDGETGNDRLGYSVSLSSDGSIVAIGGPDNSYGIGPRTGHVRIYKNNAGVWTQIGSDIDGEAPGDQSGCSVSLSSDGNTVAIGAHRNYGNGQDAGHVRIYKNIAGVWTQIGSDIDGEAIFNYSGCSVSLSADGNTLAIGAYTNDGNGSGSGHVRIYKNNAGVWTQIGNDIDGEAAGDNSGYSVSLSSDGSIVAIGAYRNDGNGNNAGHVRIYKNISGVWTQLGSDIDGEAAEDNSSYFGLSLSADGNTLAIGARYNDGNDTTDTKRGHVRVYRINAGVWTQLGSDIDGEAADDHSGRGVSLSSDGSVVAIGAWNNDGNDTTDTKRGHVRVYSIPTVGINEKSFNLEVFVYPNPTTGKITIKAECVESVEVINPQGKQIYTGKESEVDLSNQPKGIYIIKVITEKQTVTRKFIKQ